MSNEVEAFEVEGRIPEVVAGEIPLNWDVFVTLGIPAVSSDLPPGTEQRMSSPTSSTITATTVA